MKFLGSSDVEDGFCIKMVGSDHAMFKVSLVLHPH
jgi:hypothetical protein